MRVITGKYKGKIIQGYDISGTRPTMDRVKESLFAMVQNKIKGSIVLDLFAGSGSLGIEALSMGAEKICLVDNNKVAIQTIKTNTKDMDDVIILNSDYIKAIEELKEVKFDIIILDPPYQKNLIKPAINKILETSILNENGIIICEYEQEQFNFELEILKEKKYGSKNIRIYKK